MRRPPVGLSRGSRTLWAAVALTWLAGCSDGNAPATSRTAAVQQEPSPTSEERRSTGRYRLLGEPVWADGGVVFKLNRRLSRRRDADPDVRDVEAQVLVGGERWGLEDENTVYRRGRYCYQANLMERYPGAERPPRPAGSRSRVRIRIADLRRAIVVYISDEMLTAEEEGRRIDALCGRPG